MSDTLTRFVRTVRNAATAPTIGRSTGGQGIAAPSGVGSNLEAMSHVATLFAVVDRLASSVASVDWHLYRQYEPGTPVEDRVEVTAHPALSVWTKPNSFYTQREFVEAIQQHYDLTGEFWWLVAGTASTPLELWPIRPDRMKPVPDPRRFVAGYTIRVDGKDMPLGLGDVVWKRRPNPADPYRGISPLGSLASDLGGEASAARWNAQFFANSARPDGVLTTPDVLTDDEFNRLTEHWREQHQGVSNAHRIAVLEGGTYTSSGYSQKDMDFVSLRNFTKEQILEAYAFPKFMIGKVDGIQRATAWAAVSTYVKLCVTPRLDLIREALNESFLPLFGQAGRGVQFDYGDPIPPDPEDDRAELASKVSAWTAMVAQGADPAEAADVFGLPAMSFAEPAPQVQSAPPAAPAPQPDNPDNTEQGDTSP